MLVVTHVLDHNCLCARCGADLTGPLAVGHVNVSLMKRGDRVGLITGLRFTPDSAYRITIPEFDSNQFCIPRKDSVP